MTAEFLLEAIGQIDDDLILDGEAPAKRRPPIRQWAGLAAALILCAGLSSPFLFRQAAGKSTGSEVSPSSPSGGSGAPPSYSHVADSTKPEVFPSPKPGTNPSPDDDTPQINGLFFTERGGYDLLRCKIDTLPDGCRSLGTLWPTNSGTPHYPATADPNYAGCPVWENADGSVLYLQLPNGNWLAAQLILPLN